MCPETRLCFLAFLASGHQEVEKRGEQIFWYVCLGMGIYFSIWYFDNIFVIIN